MAYQYLPLYGVEPFNPLGVPSALFGGGADVTTQNLLITLWTVTTAVNNVPTAGQLMRPYTFTPDGIAALALAEQQAFTNAAAAYKPAFPSRYSARISISAQEQELTPTLFAILQPPQDVKNYVSNAIRSVSLDPSKVLGVNIKVANSLLTFLGLNFYATDQQHVPANESCLFSGAFSPMPVYKTNGADGVFPVAYAGTTPADFLALFNAFITGDYYIGAVFTRDDDESRFYNFDFPGSNARR